MMTSASCGADGAIWISQSTRKESKSVMHRIISPTIASAPATRKIEIRSSDANQPQLKFVVKCREAAKRNEEAFLDYRIPKKPTQRKKAEALNKTALAVLAVLVTSTALADDFNSRAFSGRQPSARSRAPARYPWKTSIVTTVFWIGERPSGNNPVPNRTSSWDKQWTRNYGGFDDPNPANRSNYRPAKFTPRQNPFYCALPYNDKQRTGHRTEAPRVVPWFKEAYQGPAVSTCKDRWVAIRKGNRTAYAQWEDAGPFRTDHWQYVFGNERPKLNLNKGAGLDVSPAVRDYLGLKSTDLTDWKFVDFSEVPRGPWSSLGENNTFVINDRKNGVKTAKR